MAYIYTDLETFPIDDVQTYLEPVSAPSNYKDEAKKADYIAEKTQELADKAALDPDLCRIVALGWAVDDRSVIVKTAETDAEERDALEWFWRDCQRGGYLNIVTFNGVAFDLPVLLRRSLYLGVRTPDLKIDKYRHPQVIDLLQVLSYNGALKYHSLNFYTQRFGLPPVDDDAQGKDIAELVRAGAWDAVKNHCRADVERTRNLAIRIGAVPVTEKAIA